MPSKRPNSSEEYQKKHKKTCKCRAKNSRKTSRNYVTITTNMIRSTLKTLLLQRAFVNSEVIGDYLCRYYPIRKNKKIFDEELKETLKAAVRKGLIRKQGRVGYYLPTLREEAHYTYMESDKYKAPSYQTIENNRNRNAENNSETSDDEIEDLSH